MIAQAFAHNGPALVDVLVHRQELSMPPTISLAQLTGFGIFMIKAVLSGRGDEIVDLAKNEPLALGARFHANAYGGGRPVDFAPPRTTTR